MDDWWKRKLFKILIEILQPFKIMRREVKLVTLI